MLNNNNQKMGNYKSDSYTHYTKQQQIMSFYRGIKFLTTTTKGVTISIIVIVAIIIATAIDIMYVLIALLAIIFLPYVLGEPLRNNNFSLKFAGAGIKNVLGEPPILKNKKILKNGDILYEMKNNGIAIDTYMENELKLSSALNRSIYKIEYGKSNNIIKVFVKPAGVVIPEFVEWTIDMLDFAPNAKDSIVDIGVGLGGVISNDLQQVPHMIVGGSTGSGKSITTKLMLFQCYMHDCEIYVADFKYSEFGFLWEKVATVINTIDDLDLSLEKIVKKMDERRKLFRRNNMHDILDYRKSGGTKMRRIIVCIDEVAELTDTVGLDKLQKEKVNRIIRNISTIARQGRCYAINLILSGQRPDSEVLRGQIKNNCNFSICGRADSVLSTIVVGDGSANTKIPKDAQGRFVLNDEAKTVFQAYYFDESILKNI